MARSLSSIAVEGKNVDVSRPPASVSLSSLLRFASTKEMLLNSFGLLMSIAAGCAQPLMTLFFGNLTNSVTSFGRQASNLDVNDPMAVQAFKEAQSQLRDAANRQAVYFVYVGIGLTVATYLYTAIFTYTGQCITDRIRETYMRALLRQEMAYFDQVGAGHTSLIFQGSMSDIQAGISDKLPICVMNISTFAAGLVMAYARSWKLALVLSSIIPALVIAGLGLDFLAGKSKQKASVHAARASAVAMEGLSAVKIVRSYDIGGQIASLFDSHQLLAYHYGCSRAVFQGASHGLVFFIIYATYALGFFFGSKLLANGEMSEGTIVNVFLSMLIGSFALASIGPAVNKVLQATSAGAKILPIIQKVSEIDPKSSSGISQGLDISSGEAVHFQQVSFSYASRSGQPALLGLNLCIPRQKMTAIVGPSGSGKSTLIALLERFYDVDDGQILLAGKDIREYNPAYLRSQIGLVTQDSVLFSGTVFDNVIYGLVGTPYENASRAEQLAMVEEACRNAHAYDFVMSMGGFDAEIKQDSISVGQRARLNIARACIKKPALLLLDEATASLDADSEMAVHSAVRAMTAYSTVVVVAHRLQTVRDADKIAVVSAGKVVDEGTHDELVANGGMYSVMVEQQAIGGGRQDGESGGDMSSDEAVMSKVEMDGEDSPPTDGDSEVETAHGKIVDGELMVSKEKLPFWADMEKQATSSKTGTRAFPLLWQLWKRDTVILPLYVLGGFGGIVFGMIYPVYTIFFGKVLQALQNADSSGPRLREIGSEYALYLFIISIVAALSLGLSSWILDTAAERLGREIRSASFYSLLCKELSWFNRGESRSIGALVSRIDADASSVTAFSGPTIGIVIQGLTTVVGGAAIALAYGWKLALVTIACYPLTISAGLIQLWAIGLKDARIERSHHESADVASETINHIRVTTAYNNQERAVSHYLAVRKAASNVAKKEAFRTSIWYALSNGSSFFVIALGFWYGIKLVSEGEYSTQQLITCFSAVVFGSTQAGYVFAYAPDLSSARRGIISATNLMSSEGSEKRAGSQDASKLSASFNLESVRFQHQGRPQLALNNVDLQVPERGTVAIVGQSGCGKSTLFSMLERLYEPMMGSKVLMDKTPVNHLEIGAYRKQMALVSQDDTLFSGTIRFNLALGSTSGMNLSDEDAASACREAHVWDFVNTLENGLDTLIGPRSAGVSGGQRARLMLARAFVRNPRVLLLDEVTSSLDAISEKAIEATMREKSVGRTTVIVAHRLTSIRHADTIFVMEDGRVCEQGTFDELVRKKGVFAGLVLNQSLESQVDRKPPE